MKRCPNCQATNPVNEEGGGAQNGGVGAGESPTSSRLTVQCRRCAMELTKLLEIEQTALQLTQRALWLLIQDDSEAWATARQLLQQSLFLKQDTVVAQIYQFALNLHL